MKEKTNWTSEDKINLLDSLNLAEIVSVIKDENLRKKFSEYMMYKDELKAKEIEKEQFKAKREKLIELSNRFQVFSIKELYPFNCCRSSYHTKVIVYSSADGEEYVSKKIFTADKCIDDRYVSYDHKKRDKEIEAVREKAISEIENGNAVPEGFLSKNDFEEIVIGPILKVDGKILSIPRGERFKLMVVYCKEFTGAFGYKEGDETKIGCIDLLTGFGGYPSGRLLSNMKESIQEEIKVRTFKELRRANLEFNFFFLDKYNFVPMSCEDVPDHWQNCCRGNMITGLETHGFKWWREKLLEKYGFRNIDFTFADTEELI